MAPACLALAGALLLAAPPPLAAAGSGGPGFTVAILGDGFADALVEGLRADLGDVPDTTIVAATHAPFGLAEAARFDWPGAVRALLADRHPDAAVIMLGAEDMVPLPDGAGIAAPHGERWRQLYGDRVQALAELFHARGVPLTWVGLPVVADEATSAGFVERNAIVRDRAAAAGATYVDVWNAFTDEAGRYSAVGPDANGRPARLRTSDGAGFTRAGATKLASFVEGELRTQHRPKPDRAAAVGPLLPPRQRGFDAALSIDVNAQIRREASLPPKDAPAGGKAAAGPVIPLTAPVVAPDGRLVPSAGETAPSTAPDASLARRALVEGRPIPPKAGRLDDFSWPRP